MATNMVYGAQMARKRAMMIERELMMQNPNYIPITGTLAATTPNSNCILNSSGWTTVPVDIPDDRGRISPALPQPKKDKRLLLLTTK